MTDGQWDCAAYGRAGTGVGVLCFLSDLGRRLCASPTECETAVAAARIQLFDRIQDMAAQGDEIGLFLAGEFTSPDQLFAPGGGEEDHQAAASPDQGRPGPDR